MTTKTNLFERIVLIISSFILLNACDMGSAPQINTIAPALLTPMIDGWAKDGDKVECNNLAELSRQINGGAPFFIDRGAKKIIFQDYTNTKRIINLEIYQMGNKDQAKTLYNDVYVEKPIAASDIGETARISAHLVGAYAIDFINDNYYSKLTILEKSAEAKTEIDKFAKTLSKKMQGSSN
jgi:hypothetical protein